MDELPWLATPKSKLLQMIDYFWNTTWSQMPQVKLFVCGSAASWMINNIINAKGGLHNRLSGQLLVKPFNLRQTHTFLKHTGYRYTKLETLKLYMGLGGIPYYLEKVDKNISALDNLFKLCIDPSGQLHQEFFRLFQALFDNHQEHTNIIKQLAAHHYGLSRQMLIKKLGLASGGRLTKRLQELEAEGFIQSIPALHKKNSAQFRLIDEYCLFYLKWIQDHQAGNVADIAKNQWSALAQSPSSCRPLIHSLILPRDLIIQPCV